ncbi:MAG: hypothetical protein M3Q52_11860 [Pseudomonadota bacterium]|nr:hypothetical protein [Pseudomonadota bacterium]
MTDRSPENPQSGESQSGLRQRAIGAYGNARGSVSDAGRRAEDTINEAPFIALAGGIAAGALLAALLPRTRAEERVLGPVGDRVKGSARAAAAAAKEAGTARLDELGLTRDRGAETLRSIFQGAGEAARTSAEAAVGAVRKGE